jgi:hypothetical protein
MKVALAPEAGPGVQKKCHRVTTKACRCCFLKKYGNRTSLVSSKCSSRLLAYVKANEEEHLYSAEALRRRHFIEPVFPRYHLGKTAPPVGLLRQTNAAAASLLKRSKQVHMYRG